jgi:hypothetical protein
MVVPGKRSAASGSRKLILWALRDTKRTDPRLLRVQLSASGELDRPFVVMQ